MHKAWDFYSWDQFFFFLSHWGLVLFNKSVLRVKKGWGPLQEILLCFGLVV